MWHTDDVWHRDFLDVLAQRMQPELYVELGCATGATLMRVAKHARRAIGVDLHEVSVERAETFAMPTQEFLKEVLPGLGKVSLCFVDADHDADACEADVRGVLPYMAKRGLVVLHDTFPESEHWRSPALCGTAYKVPERFEGSFTLRFPPGLTLINT